MISHAYCFVVTHMKQQEKLPKNKYFSLRLSTSLAERIEQAKVYFGGGISTGETARRLMERGLNQIDQNHPDVLQSLQERPREALLAILSKRRDHIALTQAEWIFLAESVHQAYRSVGEYRDGVARDLLVDILRAFKAVIRLRKRQYGKLRGDQNDHRYMSYFGHHGDDIEASVEGAIATLPAYPSPAIAQEGSRILYHVLVDYELDRIDLHTDLEAYFEALSQVALRGYFIANGTALLEDPDPPRISAWFSNQKPTEFKIDDFVLKPVGLEHDLMARLSFNDFAWSMDLSSYVELTEFAQLVWTAAQSDEGRGAIRSDPFRISWHRRGDNRLRTYVIHDERASLTFSTERMSALSDVLTAAVSDPDIRVHMERLTFVYGRI